MTIDQAIAIRVRLNTAVNALSAALEVIKECDRNDPTVRTDLELNQAMRHAGKARGICSTIIAGGNSY